MEKIENNLKNKYYANIIPDKTNYDSLVKIEIKDKKTILLNEARSSEMHNNSFPFSTHKFEFNETERILKIINDSASFDWGEIGTPYYDKIIVFFDRSFKKIFIIYKNSKKTQNCFITFLKESLLIFYSK